MTSAMGVASRCAYIKPIIVLDVLLVRSKLVLREESGSQDSNLQFSSPREQGKTCLDFGARKICAPLSARDREKNDALDTCVHSRVKQRKNPALNVADGGRAHQEQPLEVAPKLYNARHPGRTLPC